ncbi:MAG: YIP1 family protein [Clostridia bacterium]|nr:YIP1 family protein [Clostridia bacterium]
MKWINDLKKVISSPYEIIQQYSEEKNMGLPVSIVLILASFNGLIAPVLYYLLKRNEFDLTLNAVQMGLMFGISVTTYLLVCCIFWMIARLFRREDSTLSAIVATWGFSFIPTLIGSIVVNLHEYFFYYFIGNKFLLLVLNTLLIMLLIWKAIFYFIEMKVVLRLKGVPLLISMLLIGILFFGLMMFNARMGLKVPML